MRENMRKAYHGTGLGSVTTVQYARFVG